MLIPSTLLQNRYHILRQIGGGGMGVVYLAEDTRLAGRYCAIKEMSPAQLAPQDRNWATSAFQQEAQMLARLSHPGLTAVTDFFPEAGDWYLVMDYVEGETLETRLERSPGGRLPLDEALNVTRQLCNVLEYLHERHPPVVFRDLKPGNVMLTPQGEVKLIDFGIARFFKPGQTRDTVSLGTPGYAAPEQYGGLGQTDPRSDVYGLGALLHQMVTGYDPTMTPFNLPPPRQINPGVPPSVEAAIQRALQVDLSQRFQNVDEMRRALQPPPPSPSPPLPPPPSPWKIVAGVGGVLLMLLACGAILVPAIIRWLTPSPTPRVTSAASPSGPTQTPVVMVLTPTPVPPTRTPVPTSTPTIGPSPSNQVFVGAGTFIRGSTRADIQSVLDQLCPGYTDSWCRESSFEDELSISEVPNPEADVFYIENHQVYRDSFYMDRYEVTNADYARCVAAGVCTPPEQVGNNPRHLYFKDPRYADCPVIYVAWHDAQTYCAWAGGRLPTADEWEKAARGTDGRWWPWGNRSPANEANFRRPGQGAAAEEDTTLIGGDPAPVGSFPGDSSPYGVMGMAGNVMEWVDAWYGPDRREIRGGSWNTGSFALRAAGRTGRDPYVSYFDLGFRCAYDAGP